MYLSKIELDSMKMKTRISLKNPSLIHGTLASNYPGQKILWRIDEVGPKRNLLLMSERPEDYSPLKSQFGVDQSQTATTELSGFLNRLSEGSQWRFRLKANPVYRTINKKTNRKAYCHYMNNADRLHWLEERSEKNGFKIDSVSITGIENIRFKRQGKTVTLSAATFDGVLSITDPEKFKSVFQSGIGHGKAYGLGLLSLALI